MNDRSLNSGGWLYLPLSFCTAPIMLDAEHPQEPARWTI
jgi:hypothetical protein